MKSQQQRGTGEALGTSDKENQTVADTEIQFKVKKKQKNKKQKPTNKTLIENRALLFLALPLTTWEKADFLHLLRVNRAALWGGGRVVSKWRGPIERKCSTDFFPLTLSRKPPLFFVPRRRGRMHKKQCSIHSFTVFLKPSSVASLSSPQIFRAGQKWTGIHHSE